jgi:HEAT repeat protein
MTALQLCRGLQDPTLVAPLSALIEHDDSEVRLAAIEATLRA